MERTRPILYGVADYAQIRKKNGWFIDRTAKIRDLEATAYALEDMVSGSTLNAFRQIAAQMCE